MKYYISKTTILTSLFFLLFIESNSQIINQQQSSTKEFLKSEIFSPDLDGKIKTISGIFNSTAITETDSLTWKCGFDSLLYSRFLNFPNYQQQFDSLETAIENYILNNHSRNYSTTYTIPVVVHVIHKASDLEGSKSNISYEQIQSQINALNAAFLKDYPNYNKQNHGIHSTNIDIKFCLAEIPTPTNIQWANGNTECGVIRYSIPDNDPIHEFDFKTEQGALLAITNPTGFFTFTKYLNIWVISDICNSSDANSPCNNTTDSDPKIVGIGTMPPIVSGQLDGIIIRYDAFGDNSVAGNNFPITHSGLTQGKILAHEAGHYLQLYHTFDPYHGHDISGNPVNRACSGSGPTSATEPNGNGTDDPCNWFGDRCCDTPPTTVTTYTQEPVPTTCGFPAQVENYMSYSADPFMNTFTSDQKMRMTASLVNARSNLWTQANLIATGVNNSNNIDKCACCKLTSEFNFELNCPQSCVNFFISDGPGFCANSWSWVFDGGSLATYMSSYPQSPNPPAICFATGKHTITLTVSDGVNSVSTIKIINIDCCPVITANNNSPVCVGDQVQFYATSRINNTIYNWTGPGVLSSIKNPVLSNVSLADAGTYTVTVPALNGCPNTATTTVIVIPNLITSGSIFLCNDPLQLFSNDANVYWTYPDGVTHSQQQNPIIPSQTGRYTVKNSDFWTKRANVPDFNAQKGRITASAFSIGDKGYLGIGDSQIDYPNDFYQFTQASVNTPDGSWTPKQSLSATTAGLRGAVSFSIGNKGYVVTGHASVLHSTHDFTNQFWEYNPSFDTWTQKADFPGGARTFGSGFSIGNKGYMGFGQKADIFSDFWEYDREINVWTQKKSANYPSPSQNAPVKRTRSVGFSIGNKGYICTGATGIVSSQILLDDIWEFDPDGDNGIGTWTQKAPFPGGARLGAAGFSIGCKGYLGTGEGANGTFKKDFWAFDPVQNTWIQKADFGGDPRSLAIGFSVGGKGYIGTGQKAGTPVNFFSDFWEYKGEPCGACVNSAYVDVLPCPCKSSCEDFNEAPSISSWNIIDPGNPATSTLSIPVVSNSFLQFNLNDGSHLIESNNLFTGTWCCGEFSYDYQIFDDGQQSNPIPEFPVIYIKSFGKGFKFTSSTPVTRSDGWVKIRVPINDCQFNSTSVLGTWEPIAGTIISDWFNVLSDINHLQFEVLQTFPIQKEVRFDNICLTPEVPTFSIEPSCNDLCVVTNSCCQNFSYQWLNGPATQCITNVTEGTEYSVEITDQHGIKYTLSFVAPPQLHINCYGGQINDCYPPNPSGQIKIDLTGGTGVRTVIVKKDGLNYPVQTLSIPKNITGPFFLNLPAGHYCVYVEDENGCKDFCCTDILIYKLFVSAAPSYVCLGSLSQLNVKTGETWPHIPNYIFSTSGGAFVPLPGGTSLPELSTNDAITLIPIGFTFIYEGDSCSELYVSSNGFLSLSDSMDAKENKLDSVALRKIIAPLWDDLSGKIFNGADSLSGTVTYLTSGAPGDRVLTIEWLNWFWNLTATGSSISFQVKLYENDKHIEFIYRRESDLPSNASASIGLSGSSVGEFLSLEDASASPGVSTVLETNNISSRPANGQVYSFTPPVPAVTYLWSPAIYLDNAMIENPVANPPSGTTVYSVTVSNGACSATGFVTVSSGLDLICSPITVSSATICAGSEFSVTANSFGGGSPYNYAWDDGVGGIYPNSKTITANLPSGVYNFDCIITDQCQDHCTSSVTITISANPDLGNYSSVTMFNGGNTTVVPNSAPLNTLNAVAYTNTNFTGELTVDPVTGVVTITNAKQAGTYLITIKAFGGCEQTTTATCTLNVINTPCNYSFFTNADDALVGSQPYAVAIGDFNSDGYQDMAVAIPDDNSVSIRTGDGAGNFIGSTNVSVGNSPRWVSIDDFNGDGFADIATANVNSNSVSIRLGNGFGDFTGSTEVPVGIGPYCVAIGDFNGDGKKDFVAVNVDGGNVSIRIGDGAGNFSGSTQFPIGTFPFAAAVGDFNNDGKQDLAVSSFSNSVSIRLGDGLGNFSGNLNVAAGAGTVNVQVGDFNNDGNLDIVSTNQNSNNVSILLGDGTGNFNVTSTLNVGVHPWSSAVGDFNGDGKQDIVTANYGGDVSELFGDGAGGFTNGTDVSVANNPYSIAVGDFNNDRKQDLAITNFGSNTVSIRLGDCSANAILNLNLFLEGFYLGGGVMVNCLNIGGVSSNPQDVDTIFISAMNPIPPFEEVDHQMGILKTNGNVAVIFSPSVVANNYYYLKIKHRNSIETWSKNPVLLSTITFYSFSSDASQSFGNNLKNIGDNKYGIISGDVNQDGIIDLLDYIEIETDALIFNTGYLNTDLTGDWIIESSDFSLIENNLEKYVKLPYRIKICNQDWMTKNLDVSVYRNGDTIPQVTDPAQWTNLTSGAWCYYNNDPAMGAIYGKLYNWYAVNDPRGLAPNGWHIPSDAEWNILEFCLGGSSIAGGKMKETGTLHWLSPNFGATNSSGFNGLPSGLRADNGTYVSIGSSGYWWSSTELNSMQAWDRSPYFNNAYLDRPNSSKLTGMPVRCIKN